MAALSYKGDIKVYLTAFQALNTHTQLTGEALQNKVNLALPIEIIDMRFAQNTHLFTEDELFLVSCRTSQHVSPLRKVLFGKVLFV
jgi:hypothetical protein